MEQLVLDLIPTGAKAVCHVSQNDIGRTIRFNLVSGGTAYTLAGTETIKVFIKKPDGTTAERNIANTSSTYVDWVTGEVDCDVAGKNECELVITAGSTVIGSKNFAMKVEEDPYDGAGVITKTASGAIASFETNLADELQEVKCEINAKQDLHGYDHPWAGGAGKNKLHITATSQTINGITYTVKSDGTITANGTATAESTLVLVNGTGIFDFTTEMVLNGSVDGFGSSVRTRFGVSGVGSYDDFGNGVTIPIISDISSRYSYVQITIASGTTVNNVTFKPMISTTGGDFEPYSNICPIVGHSELNLTRCGVNLWDEQTEKGNIDTTTGEDTPNNYVLRSVNYIKVSPNTTLYTPVSWIQCYFYDANKTYISYQAFFANTISVPNNAEYMRFRLSSDYGTTYNNDISINYPSSDTDYHAYNGQTFTVAFGQTVYGGTYDKSGRLTITHRLVTENDFNEYNAGPSGGGLSWVNVPTSLPEAVVSDSNISSHLPFTTSGWGATSPCFVVASGGFPVRVYCNCSSLEDFKTQFSGLQIAYKLATPIVIDVPSISVFAEKGTNNVFGDTGDTEVKYLYIA